MPPLALPQNPWMPISQLHALTQPLALGTGADSGGRGQCRSHGMGLRLQEQSRRWAHRLVDAEHIFILGKGYAEPIAREGALKIKECAYVHAEGTVSASRLVSISLP